MSAPHAFGAWLSLSSTLSRGAYKTKKGTCCQVPFAASYRAVQRGTRGHHHMVASILNTFSSGIVVGAARMVVRLW